MKILDVDQIRSLDAYTIENEPISSLDLMERASQAFVRWFCNQFVNTRPASIFCGKGNNGGDGLAIARILSGLSYQVNVYIVEYSADSTPDFASNLQELQKRLQPYYINTRADFPTLIPDVVCIDAILGSGLSRPAQGLLAETINTLNYLPNKVIAVDIASGLYADKPNDKDDLIIKPDYTISFQLPKLAFMLPQNASNVGDWHIVDIGLNEKFIEDAVTNLYYTEKKSAEKRIRPRQKVFA